ncbi:MAG TPA: class I SAM-dependent methyltransferase [Gemmatimonadaceae bacterium]
MSDPELVAYYKARAAEYERVYEKPERQADLRRLHEIIPPLFEGRRVLELACGTGYWTRRIVPHVASLTGVDAAPETLLVARANQPAQDNVTLRVGDVYDLAKIPGEFDAAFAGFWWSHVRRRDLARFLGGLHARLEPNSLVVFADNCYVEGSSWPITRPDANGDTFQSRTLENGSRHKVLKNFPTPDEVKREIEAAGGVDVSVVALQHYWYATYYCRHEDA